jgi:hypothetical protein
MALDISRIPPKGSIGYKYFRANITSAERAELDAYEAKMAATPKKDTGTKQSTSTNASANDYFDFLGDDYSGFDYVAPPLSQTDAFKEWQATVNTDRGSDEYSLQRYPDQDEFFLGEMDIPAWFPESYSAYRKAGGLSGGIAYNNPNPEFGAPRLIEESRNSAEENLAKFTQTLIENGGAGNLGNIDFGNLDSMLAALQDTPFDLDALLADTKSFGGQTISEQEWFSPEREEIVRKFFEGQSNDPLDRGSLIKGQTWEEAKTALARGVDPDSVFAELNTLSNKSHDDFAAMEFDVTDVNRMAGPQQAFRDLSDAHFIETFNTFNNELDTLRQEDPDAFQAAYEFLRTCQRLTRMQKTPKTLSLQDM